MPLEIRIEVLHAAGDKLHMRHFFEALLKSPHATVRMDSEAPQAARDFTFAYGSSYVPPSGKSIVYFACDPHALAEDISVEDLVNPKLDALGQRLGVPADFRQKARSRFLTNGLGRSVRPYIDRFDYCAALAKRSLADKLHPLLNHAQTFVVPHTVPEWIFNASFTECRPLDMFFIGAWDQGYYPLRAAIRRELDSKQDERIRKLKFEWPQYALPSCGEMAKTWTREQFDRHQTWYASKLQHAKVCAFDGGIYDYPLSRHMECMATGCVVLSPMPHDSAFLGFKDGVNMVAIDPDNWKDKLLYYTSHEKERLEIAKNAYDLVTRYHTCGARAEIVIEQLKRIKAGATIEEIAWHAKL
jgi:hypothetical protein